MTKVTKETVKIFANGIKDFMTHLGLGDWEITLKQEDLTNLGDNTLACVAGDIDNCVAAFEIAENWPETEAQVKDNIRKTALHECLHVLLYRYDRLAQDRFTTEKQLADAEHDVIRRLVMLYTETRRKDK